MSHQTDPGERMLLEFQARDAWNQRNYAAAQKLAEQWAAMSFVNHEEENWWNASFLVSECLRKQDRMNESLDVADELTNHPLTQQSVALQARIFTLRAFALQGSGDLAAAVSAARSAVAAALTEPVHSAIAVEAQNALIASLAESGKLEEAWKECLVLAQLLSAELNTQTTGLGYWAIGNVAFLLKNISEGVSYHELAAKTLSPTNDLDLWARFNRGSADFRLAAGVLEPETLECIERAELASSIVGGTERDRLELKLIRAQWLVLTGQFQAAVENLTEITAHKHLLASHVAAHAHFLLGQALSGRGSDAEAIADLELSEDLFLQSGAEDRAASARALIDSIQGQ
jgi:tetratricopeptide (TPR) repeat protein